MADRYDDRYRGEEFRGERAYGRDERPIADRVVDEVRSWVGDDEAERRRRMDEQRYGRDWDYGHRMGFDYGRPPARSWSEPPSGEPFYRGGYSSRSYSTGFAPGATYREYNDTGRYGQGWERGRGMEGLYAGRGPRGYQRSDERIREDVCDRLSVDPWVDATDIEVTVLKGEVTLAGTVRDRNDKRRTEDLIENVSGVREVHNNLRVGAGQAE